MPFREYLRPRYRAVGGNPANRLNHSLNYSSMFIQFIELPLQSRRIPTIVSLSV